jgi:hypothetical protein
MLGCSGLIGRLTSTPCLGLARDARQRRHAVARRGHGTSRWQLARIIGHGAMAGRSRAGRGVGAFAEWAQQNAAWAVARVDRRPDVASVCASGRWIALASLSVLVFGAKWFGGRVESIGRCGRQVHRGRSSSRRGVKTQPAPCLENLVGDDGVRGTSRPQPPPSEEGVAVRYTAPSIFGMTAAQRGASAPLRGSPLTQADAAGRVIPPPSQSRLGTRRGAWVVISGREVCQPVRFGRPQDGRRASRMHAYLRHNLQLMHRLEDYP